MALTDNLTAYYKLDTNNSTQPDEVGSYDGTVSGAVYTAGGKINGCYDFDGSNDKITMSKSVIASGTFTLSLWEYNANSGNGYQASDGGNINNFYCRRLNSGADIRYKLGADSPTVALAQNQWNHLILTCDGSNSYLYANDSLLITKTGLSFTGLTTEFVLGNRTDLGRPWNGLLDEVAIWSRVITSGERTELYNGGSGLQYPFTSGVFTPYYYEKLMQG